jgi:hypothetical protein
MNPIDPKGNLPTRYSILERIDQICDAFEEAWKQGQRPRIEEYLGTTQEPERSQLLRELLQVEVDYRRRS